MSNNIAAYIESQEVHAVYPLGVDMSIEIDEYPYKNSIIVPRGDSAVIVFDVYGEDGLPFDISGAYDIEFAAAIDKTAPPFVSKSLLGGGVSLVGDYSFSVAITIAESKIPHNVKNYFEAAVRMTSSDRRTVAAGVWRAVDTVIGS